MTVVELIRELQQLPPQLPVRVVLGEVLAMADELGDSLIGLCDDDATEADDVRHMGTHVLVRGR